MTQPIGPIPPHRSLAPLGTSMMRPRLVNLRIEVGVLACLSCIACSLVCPRVPEAAATVRDLAPGTYELTMAARSGSRRGFQVSGRLTLIQLDQPHWGGSLFYGFTDIDLDVVGAPVLPDSEVPLPTSKDPDAPGVLVESVSFEEGYPDGTPVLLISTSGNRNPVVGEGPDGAQLLNVGFDGAGIGLWVHRITTTGFVGRWSEWGIVRDARGVFCAQLIQ